MIVLDASALVELLLTTERGSRVAELIGDPEVSVHAPELADIEVCQVLRRMVSTRLIDAAEAEDALAVLRELDLERHSHEPLLERVWELRENLTAYDAVYVALAEALDATLLTLDAKLARSPGWSSLVRLVD